jgi:hypothetical protein
MTPQEHLDRLDQRRRYLEARIQAKKSVGWETLYDQSERDALAWIIGVVAEPVAVEECPHPEDRRISAHNLGEAPKFYCQICKQTVAGVA